MKMLLNDDEYYPFYSLVDKAQFSLPSIEITALEYLRYQQVMKDFEEVQDWLHYLYLKAHK